MKFSSKEPYVCTCTHYSTTNFNLAYSWPALSSLDHGYRIRHADAFDTALDYSAGALKMAGFLGIAVCGTTAALLAIPFLASVWTVGSSTYNPFQMDLGSIFNVLENPTAPTIMAALGNSEAALLTGLGFSLWSMALGGGLELLENKLYPLGCASATSYDDLVIVDSMYLDSMDNSVN